MLHEIYERDGEMSQNGVEEVAQRLRIPLAELWGVIDPMPCAGRCDQGIPILVGDQVHIGDEVDPLSPLPPVVERDSEECLFARIREPGLKNLEGYGGYQALEMALKMSPDEVRKTVAESRVGPKR